MSLPRVRFTVRRLMVLVAVAALLTVVLPNPFGSGAHRYDTWCPSPQIEGEVVSVDRPVGRVELSVGSDDGLATGHELFVWRDSGRSAPLGKLRVISLGYDRAV